MYIDVEDNTRIILGFAPKRFVSDPEGTASASPSPRTNAYRRGGSQTRPAFVRIISHPRIPEPRLERRAPRFAGHGSRTTLRGTRRDTQICGVQCSILNRFRIDTPKRLKIAATQRKQSSRVISNRYKNRGVLRGAIRSGSRSAGPFAPAQGRPTCPELSKGFRPELDCKSHSAGKFRGKKNY